MKKFLFIILFTLTLPAYSSHIVGGEFELIHLTGYKYQLNMVLYFDDINGSSGAVDDTVKAAFFQKSNNALITSIILLKISRTNVHYSQPACTSGYLKTDRLIYTGYITLSPTIYKDPAGYYISWQRCCRNYNITNIYSPNPRWGVNYAGQTFYLEFPPVIVNGTQFVDSTPHLFPALSDYGCPGRPYYVNFAGQDDDGDSLAYSLTTPLNTVVRDAYPPTAPAPYPLVKWRSPYSLSNIMGGTPDLKINSKGVITCTPVDQGLFVFAVKIEEYRNKKKIGETRRDFQLLVVDGCQPDLPPKIVGKKLTDATFGYSKTMTVSFDRTVTDDNRCIQVQVSDPDSNNSLHKYTEGVSIKVVPLSFNANISSILPTVTSGTLTQKSSTIDFRICFPKCPFVNGPFTIGIVAYDDACSLPLTDTLKVTVTISVGNSKPYFVPPKIITAQLNEGTFDTWPFTAKDDDGDPLTFSSLTNGFTLSDVGVTYNILNQQPGLANGTLNWNARCKFYDFSKRSSFRVKILVGSKNVCNFYKYDTATFNLSVVMPVFNPKLKIYNQEGSADVTNRSVKTTLGAINLDVVGTDNSTSTADTLKLWLYQATGNVPPAGYTFASAVGLHRVESPFLWNTDCSIFKNKIYDNHYKFKFIVANFHCIVPRTDTAYVNVEIKDVESTDDKFNPANVITTVPDHCNDFFAIDGFDTEPPCIYGSTLDRTVNAPADNCINRFKDVEIYNRWGLQVFTSTDRKFRWYATHEAAGIYFCILHYTNKQYKTSITVIR